MNTITTAFEAQWVGALPGQHLPLETYLRGAIGFTTALAVVFALVALVSVCRSSPLHHALAEQAATASVVHLVVAVVVTMIGAAFALSIGGWWWVLIGAWSIAAATAAGVRLAGSRRRPHPRDAAATDGARS